MRNREKSYRPFPGDELLVVEFYTEAVKNEVKTHANGYGTYEDVDMIKILVPADKQLTIIAPALSTCNMDGEIVTYADRFPDDYERFKAGKGMAISGMPLKEAPFLGLSEIKTLNSLNIFSVEQLADLGGQALKNVGMSGRKWQQQAVAFLEKARGARDDMAQAAEIASLKEQLEEMRATMAAQADAGASNDDSKAALKDQIEELTGVRPRGNPSLETLERMLQEAREAA